MQKPFSNISFFENDEANNFCDEICSLLYTNSEQSFPPNFALTGRAAVGLIKREDVTINNICFVCSDIEKYYLLASKLSNYNVKNYIKYKEKLMFKYLCDDVAICFEIYYDENSLDTYYVDGIVAIHVNSIPNELL